MNHEKMALFLEKLAFAAEMDGTLCEQTDHSCYHQGLQDAYKHAAAWLRLIGRKENPIHWQYK